MKKADKGEAGYRAFRKKKLIIYMLIGIAVVLIQLLARNFTDRQGLKNILTVMAVVSVLPVANLASPFLASVRYGAVKPGLYQKMAALSPRLTILYELILTSKEQIIPADVVVIHPAGVYLYCPLQKLDEKKAEVFLKEMFTQHRLSLTPKVFKEEPAFLKRVAALKNQSQDEDDGSLEYTKKLLKDLSM